MSDRMKFDRFACIKDRIVSWLRERMLSAGTRTAVLGLSGGVDSAVVAGLAAEAFGPEAVTAVFMFANSGADGVSRAREVADRFGLKLRVLTIEVVQSNLYSAITGEFGSSSEINKKQLSLGNIASRLRMVTLYYLANVQNGLVLGTSNRTEIALGYFTKYGDGGVDVEPIGQLYKSEVYALARFIGVPDSVLDACPSAGLWPGQTDESEIGGSYADIDRLLSQYAEGDGIEHDRDAPALNERVLDLIDHSGHKKKPPAICKVIDARSLIIE